MKSLMRITLWAMFFAAAVSTAIAAGNTSVTTLKSIKKIGVGWQTDKFGWMGFVAFSPDGKMVASDGPATPDDVSGDLTVWSFPQGQLIRRLPGRPWFMSGDWKHYADHNIVRSAENGNPVISLPDKVYATYAFSDDGKYVAASSGEGQASAGIQVFDLSSGKRASAFGKHEAFSLAIDPDGGTLASGHWDVVTLWDMRAGTRVGALHGFGRYVRGLSFSRNGELLAAGTDLGGLQIWDVHHRRMLHAIKLEGGEVSAPAFSPDGRLIAVGVYGTGTVWLVDVRSGQILDHKKVSDLGCGAAVFSPDGRYLITPSTGGLITWPWDVGGTVRVFKVVSHQKRQG
jgi:WD40 repeat protein